jgi:MFS family permease
VSTELAEKLPTGSLVALLAASTLLAAAYGGTALLPLHIAAIGGNAATVGAIISSATVFTLLFALLSGHITDKIGRLNSILIGGVSLAAGVWIIGASRVIGWQLNLAGVLLGTGWSLFYVLIPIYVVSFLLPESKIRYLTLISGFQMLGIGASPVAGRLSQILAIPVSAVFRSLALAGLIACALLIWTGRSLRDLPKSEGTQARLQRSGITQVFKGVGRYPVIMIGLGACLFSTLSAFQTSLAHTWKKDYSIFFLVFITTVVACRLSLAAYVGRHNPYKVILALLGTMMAGLLLMFWAAESVYLYALSAMLFGIGYGLAYSVLNGILANSVNPEIQPQALQIFTCSYFLGIFGFPAVAGILLSRYGVFTLLATLVGIGGLELLMGYCMAHASLTERESKRSLKHIFTG